MGFPSLFTDIVPGRGGHQNGLDIGLDERGEDRVEGRGRVADLVVDPGLDGDLVLGEDAGLEQLVHAVHGKEALRHTYT